ncbi:uncharacterized protein LOC116004037 [Ipomoea triloba]|uniref:uncharacterized protein LOC116004037 n=1 Tax=Ipomoea triloba TaxID=35885 RepID=UPI00125DE8C2|nr:uncharacterized protein LOC116004037 [Ipomoea triloba]
MSAERRDFVKNEVVALTQAGHVKEIYYPEWLSNIVLAPKGSTWRMCVDYTDLNRACPMDRFPLPNIDQLVDETAGCELMSFMDAFRGYHQIFMHEEDAEKTAFTTQKAFLLLGHAVRPQKRRRNLHPDGCQVVWEINGGKFLGFMVTRNGIEPNPEKGAISSVLVKEEGGTQRPIYYVSKALHNAELWYTAVEKTVENEDGGWWTLSTDGSSNSKGCGSGVVLITPEGFRAYYAIRFHFKLSNNEAEYEALLNGLRLAVGLRAEKIRIRCDSKLVVGQVTGEYEANEGNMQRYRDAVLRTLREFEGYEIHQVPREQNADADMLSKLSTGIPGHIRKIARVEDLETSNIDISWVCPVQSREPCWIDHITKYKKDGTLPVDEQDAKLTRLRPPSYVILEDKLYKRAYNGTLLKCVYPDEAELMMREVHKGVCSAHQGAYTIARRIMLQGRPATNYTPVSTAIPFSRWGIDLVGALPTGSGSRKYIIVAIDYFTKWVEAEPLASITAARCKNFVEKNILCRFGIPIQVITDNGRQFEGREFSDFLTEWGIKHSRVAVSYPQANGQVENANRTILDGLKRKLEAAGGAWVEELDSILWTYRTTPRKVTGETPFALSYGFEARAPSEVMIPSRRMEEYEAEQNEIQQGTDLNFIDERREAAFCRMENYNRQLKSYHDAKAKPMYFQVGDYVLRRREASQPLEGGKFAKKWEGPYIID